MDIKVNDYVRTKEGYICKILKLNEPRYDDGYLDFNDIGSSRIYKPNVIKTSPRIIDLIEVGDYVNGKLVIDTYADYIFDYSEEFKVIRFSETDILHNANHIKSIVTKEQFSQMEYKIN